MQHKPPKQNGRWKFDTAYLWRSVAGKMEVEGLQIRAAARQIGVNHVTLWRIGNAAAPGSRTHNTDLDTIVRICQWLNTTLDTFVIR